jgi:G:T-mismatch repair DNA endonuclease (very short patch repair protein)
MLRNRERDERSTALAQDLGWTVVRIWEHDVMRDAGEAAALVMLSATDAQSDAQP